MKKLYFVRHGESLWNTLDKICGVTDSPLTEKGRAQAVQTGQAIADAGIQADVILYSPLSRAADTAKCISEMTGIPAVAEPRLKEQCFGRWEGTSPRKHPDFVAAKKNFADNYGGGESMFRMAQRIYNVLDELRTDERTVIIVAHNGIARFVESYFRDMTNDEFATFTVPNCSIRSYDFDGET